MMAHHIAENEPMVIDEDVPEVMDDEPAAAFVVYKGFEEGEIAEGASWFRGFECKGDIVYNQQDYPFCWALSNIDTIGYRHAYITRSPMVHFSAQELINSVRPFVTYPYDLQLEKAMEFIVYNKVNRSEYVPFVCEKRPCSQRTDIQESQALHVHGFWCASHPSEEVLFAFRELGPVQIGILISDNFGLAAKDGHIYQGSSTFLGPNAGVKASFHAVTLMGDGFCNQTGQYFWRVKNSHGEAFGKKGLVDIVRDKSLLDEYKGKTIMTACIPFFGLDAEMVSMRKIDVLARDNVGVRFFDQKKLSTVFDS